MQQTHLLNSFFTHRATAACGKGCSRKSIRITQFLAKDGSSLQGAETKYYYQQLLSTCTSASHPHRLTRLTVPKTSCFDLIHFNPQAP